MIAEPRTMPPVAGWPAAAMVAGLMVTLLVPSSVLALLHINYEAPSGAAWEKVHPGSDLILLGVAGALWQSRDPRAWVAGQLRRWPGTVVFVAVTLFLTAYLIVVLRTPFTPLIDTFLVPAIALILISDLDRTWAWRLEAALHLFVAGNALLGIVEFASGWRLVPAEIGGVVQTAEVEARAFGLLGHPLASAGMAGLYAVVLMAGGGAALRAPWRLPALALQFLALGAFGGRTALVLTVVLAAVLILVAAFRLLAGREVDLRILGLGLLLAPLGVAAAGMVALSGFFDTVLNRFVDDNGSASARHAILDVFGFLTPTELLFGPDPEHLASIQHLVGIEVGVESFWFGLVLNDGLLPSLVFFAGFGLFVMDLMRRCSPAAWLPLLFFIGIISTSISLSSKTTMLEQAVALLVVMLPRAAAREGRTVPRSPEPAFS